MLMIFLIALAVVLLLIAVGCTLVAAHRPRASREQDVFLDSTKTRR